MVMAVADGGDDSQRARLAQLVRQDVRQYRSDRRLSTWYMSAYGSGWNDWWQYFNHNSNIFAYQSEENQAPLQDV